MNTKRLYCVLAVLCLAAGTSFAATSGEGGFSAERNASEAFVPAPMETGPANETRKYPFYHHEVSACYGVATMPSIITAASSVFSAVLTLGTVELSDIRSSGGISAQYYWRFNKTFYVGAGLGYEHIDATIKTKANGSAPEQPYSINYNHLMLLTKLNWFDTRIVAMYSKFGAGCDFVWGPIVEERGNRGKRFNWAAQISPVCIEMGGEYVRGFVETGIGWQGCLIFGVKATF